MASDFDTKFLTASSVLFSKFGEAATYTPPTGAATAGLTVLLERMEPQLQGEPSRERVQAMGAHIEVLVSALAAPVVNGRFAVGTESWTVVGLPWQEVAGIWRMEVRRVVVQDQGGEVARGK